MSDEIWDVIESVSEGFLTYSSTLYTTLSNNLIKEILVDVIKRTFQREGSL